MESSFNRPAASKVSSQYMIRGNVFLINKGIPLSLASAIRELDFFAQINGVTLTISSFLWAMCLKVSTKYLTPLAGSVTFSCFGLREFGGLQPRS